MKFILFLGFMSFHIAEKGGIYCEHKKAKRSNLYHVEAESTYLRRSSTVIGWINWILGLIEE